jgi:RimJ/RimL family protein N-acetyltransferase
LSFGFDAEGNWLNFGISTLNLKEIYASVQVDNVASNRFLKNVEGENELLLECQIALEECQV